MDSLNIDLQGLTPAQVQAVLAMVHSFRASGAAPQSEEAADESWRDAPSTGWTKAHVELLRANLKARGKHVQLAAFDRAVENGGFVSRDEVYLLGGYEKTRKLNNWTAPINNFSLVLVSKHGLPEDADWPIETEYGEGTGFRPALGFNVAPEIVKLMREQ